MMVAWVTLRLIGYLLAGFALALLAGGIAAIKVSRALRKL